jgi:tripartite-type tricarboxylate transporter receptor subunit TctC
MQDRATAGPGTLTVGGTRYGPVALTTCMLVSGMAAAAPSRAQDFYQGRTVTLYVANTAGSGYDAYGRLLARHMPKHLPGKPTFIVQNMPGAGSIKAAEYTYSIAPKDGSQFTLLMPGALVEPLTGDRSKYRYDPTRFSYIGTTDSGTRLCTTAARSKVKTFADARTMKIVVAATAAGSSAFDYPNMLNAFAGSKFEVVTGYPGPGDMFLAVDRGEAEAICGIDVSTYRTLRPDWLTQPGKVNFLLQAGLEPNADLLVFGIPSIWDFVAAEHRPVVELIVSQQVFQRPFLAPPGTPEAQLRQLRTAFMQAVNDPELREDARKSNLELNPKSGEEVEALVKKIYSAPKQVIDKMSAAIRPGAP